MSDKELKKLLKSKKWCPPWTVESMRNEGYTIEQMGLIQKWWMELDLFGVKE